MFSSRFLEISFSIILYLLGTAVLIIPAVNSVQAQDSILLTSTPVKQKKAVPKALKEKLDSLGVQYVSAARARELDGFYEVFTDQGLWYVSEDGNKLILGRLFSLEGEPKNLTEASHSAFRQALLAENKEPMVSFPANKERYVVHIFTDHTCPYCRQLHGELDEYHALGISINYLAFPRAGLEDSSARELEYIFCAKDSATAMTEAMKGKKPKVARCDMQLGKHLQMAQQMGITGTPGIILPDGRLIPGFIPAERLILELRRSIN